MRVTIGRPAKRRGVPLSRGTGPRGFHCLLLVAEAVMAFTLLAVAYHWNRGAGRIKVSLRALLGGSFVI